MLECHKVPRLPRKTTWQPAWKPSKKRGFAASPIATAMPQENQRLETRHVDAEKPAFRTRLPPIFTLCSFKIDVFLRVFVGTSKFCNFKIYVSCEDFVNFQLSPVDTALPMRFAKNTRHDTSKVLRLPRKMTMDTSKVLRLPRKLPRIFWKRRKSIAPATQNDFRHVTKHVWMSQSAAPATQNEATSRLKPPKMTRSAELTIGTAIYSNRADGCERLRTVADGCGRLRTVANRNATSSEHTLSPQTPRVKREPLLRIRENWVN